MTRKEFKDKLDIILAYEREKVDRKRLSTKVNTHYAKIHLDLRQEAENRQIQEIQELEYLLGFNLENEE